MDEPYRSPEGTFERIRKSVLEDYTLTGDEMQVLMYAAAKPPGWEFHEGAVVRETGWTAYKVGKAFTGLRKRGYLRREQERDERGRAVRWVTTLNRDVLIAPDKPQARTTLPGYGIVAVTSEDTRSSQVGTTMTENHSVEFRPPRENSGFSDDSPNPTRSPVVSHLQVRNARPAGDDDLIPAVTAAVRAKTGREIPPDLASAVAAKVLARAGRSGTPVHRPARYVAAAVEDEPDLYAELLLDPPPPLAAILAAGPAYGGGHHPFDPDPNGDCRQCPLKESNSCHDTGQALDPRLEAVLA
jgi:DNA-binding MarR family transcriptional regulator